MHIKVFACDLDGTLAEDGVVAPETWAVLRRARRLRKIARRPGEGEALRQALVATIADRYEELESLI